jgi:ABC-type molybdate transport system substrate-binding protein
MPAHAHRPKVGGSRNGPGRVVVGLGLVLGLLATGGSASARTSQPADCVEPTGQQVIVSHAGSLTAAFTPVEQAFTCQTGIQVQDVTGGSVDLLRQVTAGGKPADTVATADYVDIDRFLKPANAASYNVAFAHGRMVLAYTASGVGPNGKNLPPVVDPAAPFSPPDAVPMVTDDWYRVLLTPGVTVGGSHPFLDPSGYRAHAPDVSADAGALRDAEPVERSARALPRVAGHSAGERLRARHTVRLPVALRAQRPGGLEEQP